MTAAPEILLQQEIERLRARVEELERERQVPRLIFENSPEMISVIRAPEFVYELANPAFRALAPDGQIVGRKVADVWPEAGDFLLAKLREVVETRAAVRVEDAPFTIRRRPGDASELLYATCSWAPLPGVEGEPCRILGLAVETTAAVRQRQQLEESTRILRGFFDSAGVLRGVVEIVGERIRHVSCNQAAARMYGMPAEAVPGRFVSETGANLVVEALWVELYRESRRTGVAISREYERRDAQGNNRWLLATASFLGLGPEGNPRFAYTILDLTDRRQMEETLREREAHYRTLSDTMLQGVVYQDVDGRILSMNPAAVEILGKTPEEFLGGSSITVEHDCIREDRSPFPGLDHPAMVALRTGRQVAGVPMGVYNPRKGQYRWIEINAVPLFHSGESAPYQVYTIFSDITERRLAEAALRESESRLRALTDNLPEGAVFRYRIDAFGLPHVDFISAGIERLVGVPAAEYMADADAVERNIVPEDRPRLRAAIRQSMESLTRFEVEVRHIHRLTGETRWSLLRSTPTRLPDGATVWDGIELDITQRKWADMAMRQSEKRYRLLHETLRDAFVRVGMDGRILEFNEIYRQMLGYSAEELRGLTYSELTPECWHAKEEHIVQTQILPRGYSEIYEKEYRRRDGSVVPVELRTILSRDAEGRPFAMWALVRDITERRLAEAALRESRAQLEARNREVERVNRMKSEFLARSSHELRTPLNAIVGYADLLAEQSAGPLPTPYPRYVRNIQEGARHLLAMVNDLLDISRIEAGRIELEVETFDLAVALEEVLSVITPLARIKNLALDNRVVSGTPVTADRLRMKQVLYNLLSNAVKFTPDDGSIWIEAEARGEEFRVCVGDTGIGIPLGEQEAVFDEFHQVSSARAVSPAGVGLGLAITRKLVRLHGGDVRVESQPGQGSRFLVTLPSAIGYTGKESNAQSAGG